MHEIIVRAVFTGADAQALDLKAQIDAPTNLTTTEITFNSFRAGWTP